jgi:hypothetical protein
MCGLSCVRSVAAYFGIGFMLLVPFCLADVCCFSVAYPSLWVGLVRNSTLLFFEWFDGFEITPNINKLPPCVGRWEMSCLCYLTHSLESFALTYSLPSRHFGLHLSSYLGCAWNGFLYGLFMVGFSLCSLLVLAIFNLFSSILFNAADPVISFFLITFVLSFYLAPRSVFPVAAPLDLGVTDDFELGVLILVGVDVVDRIERRFWIARRTAFRQIC